MTVLMTARLKLRRASLVELDAMHAILSHPERCGTGAPCPILEHHPLKMNGCCSSIENCRAWRESMIDAPHDESDGIIVEYHGAVIGKAVFWQGYKDSFRLRKNKYEY
ncbi:MAG: hypothetical protein V2I51_19245 [Anderseniella sp.]|jgi:hypothetical protein|nr:hypothetical protein [Anderseniella sp.]